MGRKQWVIEYKYRSKSVRTDIDDRHHWVYGEWSKNTALIALYEGEQPTHNDIENGLPSWLHNNYEYEIIRVVCNGFV